MLKTKFLEFEYSNNDAKSKHELEHNIAYSLLDDLLKSEGFFEYEIIKNENGKPFLKDIPIYFSISHTNGFCAVCISDSPVGIDCEKIDYSYKDRAIAFSKRFFVDNEIELLNKNGNDVVTFFKIWTGKEAVIKKLGLNFSYLKKIDTTKEEIETFEKNNYIISIFK